MSHYVQHSHEALALFVSCCPLRHDLMLLSVSVRLRELARFNRFTRPILAVYIARKLTRLLTGPLLNSYATIATEIFEDTGVPHTLEHLIFLG